MAFFFFFSFQCRYRQARIQYVVAPYHHRSMHKLHMHNHSFGATVRLCKQWMHSMMLSGTQNSRVCIFSWCCSTCNVLLSMFCFQCSTCNVLLSMFYLQCSTFNVLLMCWTFMFRYMLYLYVSILSMLDLYISVLSMLYFYVSVLFMYGQCYCGLWSLLTVVHFFCFSVPDAYHPEAVELLVASLYCEPTCRPYGPPVRASP